MKVCLMRLSTIIFILSASAPWFVGGAPPRLILSNSSINGDELVAHHQNHLSTTAVSSPKSLKAIVEPVLPLQNLVESPGSNNAIGRNSNSSGSSSSSISASNPITDSDLQKELNELRINPDVQKPNRKQGISNGSTTTLEKEEGISSYLDLEGSSGDDDGHGGKKVGTITLDKEYTPEDIAEYIFWTGDERGVAMAINDLLNDGLMLSRDDVIKFLENVKSDLEYLKSRYRYDTSHISHGDDHLGIQPEKQTAQGQSKISGRNGHDSKSDAVIRRQRDDGGLISPFEFKFQQLMIKQAAENNRMRKQKEEEDNIFPRRSSSSSNSGSGGFRRILQKRRTLLHPSVSSYYPEFRAYDDIDDTDVTMTLHSKYDHMNRETAGVDGSMSPSRRDYVPRRTQVVQEENQPSSSLYNRDHSADPGPFKSSTFHHYYDNNNNEMRNDNKDFSEIIQEEMKVVDHRLRELSLEDIIYNLGRELFIQNFKQDSTISHDSGNGKVQSTGIGLDYTDYSDQARRFLRFIESNLIPERIPKDLEKEVLDILFTAWVDSSSTAYRLAKEQREFSHTMMSRTSHRDGK